MNLPLRYYGDPILRKKSAPITEITEKIRELIDNMIETMDANNGIGLAAIQVGYPLLLFVLRRYLYLADGQGRLSDEAYVYVNPKIIDHSPENRSQAEMCLSIPNIELDIVRPDSITIVSSQLHPNNFGPVRTQKLDGGQLTEELTGINARVALHENDHLNGVLFIDRADSISDPIKKRLREMKKTFRLEKAKLV